jgi:hypothetical protein
VEWRDFECKNCVIITILLVRQVMNANNIRIVMFCDDRNYIG